MECIFFRKPVEPISAILHSIAQYRHPRSSQAIKIQHKHGTHDNMYIIHVV